MDKKLVLISGLGLGAGLMYLFDPDRGRRRRALVRDKAVHTLHQASDAFDKTSRDAGNRLSGLVAEAGSLFKREEVIDDVLVARVRAKLGRAVAHPHAIRVAAKEGEVTLKGPVLADEVEYLLKCISSVPGVKGVENKLEVYEEAGNVPDLQGGVARAGEGAALVGALSPTARLLVGAAGGALALYGARRRDAVGLGLEAVGLGLFVRGLTNLAVKDLVGLKGDHGISIQKTINIAAPVERVFETWSRHENFPRFMSHVREVKDLGEGRYHWTVAGPAGIPIEWEAEITEQVPNQLLAWESVPGSRIAQSGVTRFQSNGDGSTRVDVKLSYHPPAGAVGHAIARLFGADPKSEMDADLMRLKSFIETGQPPHDAAERRMAAQAAQAH
jgi:uncharacterized membrane protein